MGDSDEVIAFGKRLNMNPNEQKKYKYHITTIRYNEQKAKAWRFNNIFWQIFFFGNLFIIAFGEFFRIMGRWDIMGLDYAESITIFIFDYFLTIFSSLIIISFPLMMWTGVVRSKWEGKLTRSTAYALSFLENIEHRQYLEEKQEVRVLKRPK